jgi:hypothetical protein
MPTSFEDSPFCFAKVGRKPGRTSRAWIGQSALAENIGTQLFFTPNNSILSTAYVSLRKLKQNKLQHPQEPQTLIVFIGSYFALPIFIVFISFF